MNIRTINYSETSILKECLVCLAEHHNQVSFHFQGSYPVTNYENTLENFSIALKQGISQIAVVEKEGYVIGFCKIDILEAQGKLDYLVVLPEERGKGFGKVLMDWAMQEFANSKVKIIELKVIAGNNARYLYERYGFNISAYILRKEVDYTNLNCLRISNKRRHLINVTDF